MKKVALVLNTVNVGGVAKSFIEFVKLMKDSCELDVVLFRNDGDLISQLPKDVNLIIPKGYMGTFVEKRPSCKKLGLSKYLFKIIMDGICKFTHNRKPFVNFATRHSQKLKGYDVAISYAKVCPVYDCWAGCAEYVLNNISAKKKYVINHDDYMADNFNNYQIKKIKKFDKMFLVSKSCMNRVAEKVPEIKNKLDYMYNPICKETIIDKANEPLDTVFDSNKVQLVSVGRLEQQKNYLGLIDIVKEVKDNVGANFVLNIVGDGSCRSAIEEKIKEYSLQGEVKLWGFRLNPYNIIKQCDLFVLNSIWESFGIVYIEAMTLFVPVLTINVSPAKEMVGDYGIIAQDKAEMVGVLSELISNKESLKKLKNKVLDYEFDNLAIKDKWLKYINEGAKND